MLVKVEGALNVNHLIVFVHVYLLYYYLIFGNLYTIQVSFISQVSCILLFNVFIEKYVCVTSFISTSVVLIAYPYCSYYIH